MSFLYAAESLRLYKIYAATPAMPPFLFYRSPKHHGQRVPIALSRAFAARDILSIRAPIQSSAINLKLLVPVAVLRPCRMLVELAESCRGLSGWLFVLGDDLALLNEEFG